LKTKPSFSEFRVLAGQGNLIPVYGEFLCDTETPVSTFLKVKDKSFLIFLKALMVERDGDATVSLDTNLLL